MVPGLCVLFQAQNNHCRRAHYPKQSLSKGASREAPVDKRSHKALLPKGLVNDLKGLLKLLSTLHEP